MQNVDNIITSWVGSPNTEQPLLLVSSSRDRIAELIGVAKTAFASTPQEAKQIVSGNHPDVFTLEGEKGRIYVKDIQALTPLLRHRAQKRLVIIPAAHTILPDAASALLKILEEPSTSTRFFLGSTSTRGILPTIRSRCRVVFAASDIQREDTTTIDELLSTVANLRTAGPFSGEELHSIFLLIHHLAQEGKVTPALVQASRQLRDYYKTAAVPGGNTKLAADILLASLANLRNTILYANHTS